MSTEHMFVIQKHTLCIVHIYTHTQRLMSDVAWCDVCAQTLSGGLIRPSAELYRKSQTASEAWFSCRAPSFYSHSLFLFFFPFESLILCSLLPPTVITVALSIFFRLSHPYFALLHGQTLLDWHLCEKSRCWIEWSKVTDYPTPKNLRSCHSFCTEKHQTPDCWCWSLQFDL